MIIATLLPLLSLLGDGSASSLPEPDGVVRSYDLTAIGGRGRYEENWTMLLPGSVECYIGTGSNDEWEEYWSLEPEFIVDVLRTLHAEEFEYEGRMLWVDEEHRLLVKAPPKVHEQVSRTLAFLGETTSVHTGLLVDVIHLPMNQAEKVEGLVSLTEAERLRNLEGADVRVESYTLNLRPGRSAGVDLSRRHRLLVDYDVEVAEKAFAHDPVIRTLVSGTRFDVRGAPMASGLRLALSFVQGTPTGEVETVDLDQKGLLGFERGGTYMDGPDSAQRMSIAERALAINTILPDGKALVFSSAIELNGVRGVQLLVLRRSGDPLQPVHRLELAQGEVSELYLIPREALATPRTRITGSLANGNLSRVPLDLLDIEWSADEGLLTGWRSTEGLDGAVEFLSVSCPDLRIEGGEAWTVAMRIREESDELRKEGIKTPAVADVLKSLGAAGEVVQVSVTLARRGEGASKGVSMNLPLAVGESSAVVLGVEGTIISDFDVEIANSSTVGNPTASITFDGLALVIEPRRGVSGELSLRLRGVAHLLKEESEFDPGSPMFAGLNQGLYDRLVINELIQVGKDGTGRFVIGDGSQNGGDGALVMVVQVR